MKKVFMAVSIVVAIVIGLAWTNYRNEENKVYDEALRIESEEDFENALDDSDNMFVYGTLKTLDTVSFPEIEGEYMYLKKENQKYVTRTMMVPYTYSSGKRTMTGYRTQIIHSWDTIEEEEKMATQITFCGVDFDVELPEAEEVETINLSNTEKDVYYGVKSELQGTMYINKEKNQKQFFEGKSIEETVEFLKSNFFMDVVWFWICDVLVALTVAFIVKNVFR